jgi:hypothetical protein
VAGPVRSSLAIGLPDLLYQFHCQFSAACGPVCWRARIEALAEWFGDLPLIENHECDGTLTLASPLPILRKSRMRRRARTDLSGGRPVKAVPTGTGVPKLTPRRSICASAIIRKSTPEWIKFRSGGQVFQTKNVSEICRSAFGAPRASQRASSEAWNEEHRFFECKFPLDIPNES